MREQSSYSIKLPETPRARLLKACRWCRKQKMRCDARTQMPCTRCQTTGHECILDSIDSPRRSERTSHASQSALIRSGFEALASGSPALSAPCTTSISATNNQSGGIELEQFSPQDMIAPQSAMHSMSLSLQERHDPIFMGESDVADPRGDIIARGIVSEEQARGIYERFMNGSKNFLPLFDPIRDTFDSIRSRSLFCFTVIIYLASRAVPDLQGNIYLQRVLQDEAQRLAEDSFFERPTKLETVQGMILLAAYSEKTWFSTALILRTALDSGLEKSLDTLLAHTPTPRSYLSATMEDRKLVWQTRTWLISFTLELDVASGTGRKSRLKEVDNVKLRKFLEYPLSLPSDMRTVSIIELHQLRARSRHIIESTTAGPLTTTELPAIMCRLQEWWNNWDEIHGHNGFHPGAFQRSSLKLMLNYAKVFVLCVTIARIQKLQQLSDGISDVDPEVVLNLWKSLVEVVTSQLNLLVTESAYRCQITWSPTYPALTIAFITTFAIRLTRWHPTLLDQNLVLQRVRQICEYIKRPPYPDIHRTVSIFVNYAEALLAERGTPANNPSVQSGTAVPLSEGSRQPDVTNLPRPDFDPTELLHDQLRSSNLRRDRDTDVTASSDNGRTADSRPEPVLPRLLGGMNVPNWTLSTSIADSFDLFEEGQTDVGKPSTSPKSTSQTYTTAVIPSCTKVIGFEDCPKENPKNWSSKKKCYIVFVTLLSVMNSGVSSSLPSNAVPLILKDFNVTDTVKGNLPTAVFLFGYMFGPIVWSPLSETVGRRTVLIPTFFVFCLFTLACALAPNWPALLFFRFVCGTMVVAPQTVVGGVYADMFDLRPRGRVMAFYMACSSFGPILGPIISGFTSESHGWRWTFWIDLMCAGGTMLGLLFIPETFGPVILKRRAAELSKISGENVVAPTLGVNSTDILTMLKRPLDMFLWEPIISSTSIYISLAYGLIFFYFQAYPIILPEVYNFSIKTTSLGLVPLGIGACTTGLAALWWDLKYDQAKATNKPWNFSPELHRLPLSCIGSICIVISLLWLAWTARPDIHWAVPLASGLVFGFGYQTIFISLLTYVTDAYKIYSASALAASVIVRSILGALLPFAAKPCIQPWGLHGRLPWLGL
ncbi:hypothetical protein ARAM_003674 [Aspergillus rambellii]|uniref:Zn(2)-C6 fungal-type domain-containing protein n=1 Tax=Aspergillus rambellii TaxID=308745 RepID=A0A0F8V1M8_9EURO|nr:hypothetical protein ARAM_003674 [Aspergillus rambellii]